VKWLDVFKKDARLVSVRQLVGEDLQKPG
jgi:hypothetical protein